MNISLLKPGDLTPNVEKRIHALFQQLNASLIPLPLKNVMDQNAPITIACCSLENQLIGIALMAEYTVISGHKGWIEDVVVDEAHRGKGIGRKLMEKLIETGRAKGLTDILLFTGHHRKPANQLYQNLGFQKKESQIYILKL